MAIYKIREIKDEEIKKCCICGEKIEGWGNNPWPIKEDGECCDKCNYEKVIPARIKKMYSTETTTKDISIEELSEEEKKAIEDYKKAISETNNPKLLDLFAHILKEETEHLEELQSQTAKDSVKDIPLGFTPKIENKKIISWKNIITPKVLKEELDRYNKSTNEKEKDNIKERIISHLREVTSDYQYDSKVVEEEDLDAHYKRYNDIIEKINSTFNTEFNKF